jgi:hypothetical protein
MDARARSEPDGTRGSSTEDARDLAGIGSVAASLARCAAGHGASRAPDAHDETPPVGAHGAAVFAGLDEAGYGPLLGPLTYGFTAFRCARREGPSWARLTSATCRVRGAAKAKARLVVADSKEVFDRTPRGAARLEATALAFLAQRAAGRPADGPGFLRTAPAGLAPEEHELARHPWYTALPGRLPQHVDGAALDGHCAALATALARAGLEVADCGARVVPVGALNAAFARFGNKGTAHLALGGALIDSLFERFGAEGLDLTCDRLGGRMRYGAELAGLLPWSEVHVVREDGAWSEYDVRRGERRMRIRFVEKGDGRWFAVALASCLAKHARELEMGAFNAYFGALDPSLAPTAGYVQDGRRWLRDSEAVRARVGIDAGILVRSK